MKTGKAAAEIVEGIMMAGDSDELSATYFTDGKTLMFQMGAPEGSEKFAQFVREQFPECGERPGKKTRFCHEISLTSRTAEIKILAFEQLLKASGFVFTNSRDEPIQTHFWRQRSQPAPEIKWEERNGEWIGIVPNDLYPVCRLAENVFRVIRTGRNFPTLEEAKQDVERHWRDAYAEYEGAAAC